MHALKFLLAGAAATFVVPASAQELLINGGFDDDMVPASNFKHYQPGESIGGGGWTVLGSGSDVVTTLATSYAEPGVAFVAQSGANALDLTGGYNAGPVSGVEQIVNTSLGTDYLLSFWVGNATGDGTGNSGNYLAPSAINLSIDGGAAQLFTNAGITAGTINWQQFSVIFAGTGGATSIRFNNATSGDNYAGLDSVSLTAMQANGGVPEPATWALMILGFGTIGCATRRSRTPERYQNPA